MARKTTQPDLAAMISAAVSEAVAQAVGGQGTTGKPKAGKPGRKPARKAPWYQGIGNAFITAADCHVLLGGDPAYEPRDPDAPASPRQLQALNLSGKLAELISD